MRHLIYHPESESLFELATDEAWAEALDSEGTLEDVSGIEEFETAWRERCKYEPREMQALPIGMFHCPECGEMVLAGMAHPVTFSGRGEK